MHLVVDATYELPVAFKVTKASASDITEGHALLEQLEQRQPEILQTAETLAGDKGYDDTKLIEGIRISLTEDRRIFTPIDRASYKWEKEYDKRTSVERVNSRIDVSFGFELHTIRGMEKMKVRCGLALCVMLAMALGRVKEKQANKMRSLVAAV